MVTRAVSLKKVLIPLDSQLIDDIDWWYQFAGNRERYVSGTCALDIVQEVPQETFVRVLRSAMTMITIMMTITSVMMMTITSVMMITMTMLRERLHFVYILTLVMLANLRFFTKFSSVWMEMSTIAMLITLSFWMKKNTVSSVSFLFWKVKIILIILIAEGQTILPPSSSPPRTWSNGRW